jgi:uncharacterized membrane protein YkvA (DUF1232 family)
VRLTSLKRWARAVRTDVVALWIAGRDPRVPWYAKALAILVAAYALSPLDLIPDFIPVLGYVDDLIIVPLGIVLVVRLIPEPLMREFRLDAKRQDRPKSYSGVAVIVAIWVLVVGWFVWVFWPRQAD